MSNSPVRWAFPAAMALVALNLRPTLAAIGPLLDAIQRGTGLGDGAAALLTSLPVALMGGGLLATGWLGRRLGARRGVALGLVLIGGACIWRWLWPTASALLATAAMGGLGIAIVQALMPAIIRGQGGTRPAGLTGLYSTAIMGGALLAGTVSPWIEQRHGWPLALGLWAAPALLGLMAWLACPVTPQDKGAETGPPVSRSRRAWLLMAFFGLGTSAYTLVLAWLPPFYMQLGWSATAAGAMLGAVTLAEVAAGIAVSLWIDGLPDRRPALFLALGALLAGLACLSFAPLALAWPAAVLCGLGIGALFPLSLIVAMDHGDTPAKAGAIAGFVQGGGYMLAAILPLVAGLLRQTLSDLTPAWWLMAGLCVVLAAMAARLRPGKNLNEETP